MNLLRSGIHYYIIGIIILSFGITLTILSTLGASPFDALLVGLYRTFGLSIGSWEIIVGLSIILGNSIIERKRPEYYAMLTSFLTGIGIDLWTILLRDKLILEAILGKSICLIVGIFFVSLGVAIYLQSQFAPNPIDKSMLIISRMTGMNISYSRGIISIILVIIALFFNGDVGIGTIIIALFSGVLISFFIPYLAQFREQNNKYE